MSGAVVCLDNMQPDTKGYTMSVSRRLFLQTASAVGVAYAGYSLIGKSSAYTANAGLPLIPDPKGMLDLPEGFSYTLVSETGGMMSDGFFRPGRPDGMACFADEADPTKCILTRNHEMWPDLVEGSPFGENNTLAEKLESKKLYDRKADGQPFLGGVTTVIYDLKNKRLERDYLTLAGTTGNCAGGATPWGSWLSCEESAILPADGAKRPHGFVFEVPADAQGPVDATPLKAMGRFAHEAAAIDPDTDIVYLTEDNMTGLFYRFIPRRRKNLRRGGKLQALAVKGQPSADTRNWPRDWDSGGAGAFPLGASFEVEWIDLEDVESPAGDLAKRGFDAGAARFCRGEGMDFGRHPDDARGSVYFNCTQGGALRAGQVWRYRPSPNEGKRRERNNPGTLELIYESDSSDKLDMCDNLAFAPWGDLILCEDGPGNQYLRGLSPDGRLYDIARNAHEAKSEFCGACFSPDGSVLFVNVQEPGFTLAIEGPWEVMRG